MIITFIHSLTPTMRLSALIMFISTIMAMSSTNWFCTWVGLEINMLSFIPFLTKSTKQKNMEAMCKYLIVQAFASSIMLFSGYMAYNHYESMNIYCMILSFAFMTKMGMFPSHYWFPSVLQSCDWAGAMILSTWQKVAPAVIMINNVKSDYTELTVFLLISILIGGLLGLNQTDAKTILAYSSISHMGWFLMPHICGLTYQSWYYFIMYFAMVIPIFMMFQVYSYKDPNMSSNILTMPTNMKFNMLLLLLSLAGLPPLSGFTPKLMVIYTVSVVLPEAAMFIVISSCLSLLFYLNLSINILMSKKYMSYYVTMDKYVFISMIISFMFTPMLYII
uniref:NADH dehydrogenase subunit 2 n=1 Tax=Helobdella europaea TaxID=270691 RepID=UPI0023F0FA17|nr:NADH dehydrogenase subunit 2 [Helobdella europaea]WDY83671.1 NADH dehydrogenase subunit 2 [Helobdella europaea]